MTDIRKFHTNESGQFHCADGPAIIDGERVECWINGDRVM